MKKIKMDFKHYWLCMKCAEERGASFPPNHCCTVTQGKCPYCKEVTTIIPYVDFDWIDMDTKHLRD